MSDIVSPLVIADCPTPPNDVREQQLADILAALGGGSTVAPVSADDVYDTVTGQALTQVLMDDGTFQYYDPSGALFGGAPVLGLPPAADTCPETPVALTATIGVNTSVPAGFESVTINNLSGVTTIDGSFELGQSGGRVGAISFNGARTSCTNEMLPSYTLAGGTWQWIAHK